MIWLAAASAMLALAEPSQSLKLTHAREGSGTSWQPDSTPIHAIHTQLGRWSLLSHGLLFAGYDHQGSDRGGSRWTAPNWFMTMARRSVDAGELGARIMLSLDPLTVGDRGYPLLLQSGESFDGEPLHDRQHPHDLFMELALFYSRPLAGAWGAQLYAAPVGEPALGPVAFPHRLSAAGDPLALLGHHWQDSSHISFGVVTAGVHSRVFKLEGSCFNGREPDEERYDFDFRSLDSFSGRVWFLPHRNWAFQVSHGYLDSPEALEPEVSLHRTTASAVLNLPLGSGGNWAAAFLWGRNNASRGPDTGSFGLESNLELDGRHVLVARGEVLKKPGHDLAIPPPGEEKSFAMRSLVLGYLYELPARASLIPGFGVRGSLNWIDADLEPFYGTRTPAGFMIFLRLRPHRSTDGAHHGHPGGH